MLELATYFEVKMAKKLILKILVIFLVTSSANSFAASVDGLDIVPIDDISNTADTNLSESEINQKSEKESDNLAKEASKEDQNLGKLQSPIVTDEQIEIKTQENTLKDFSGLGTLSPFREVSIIQRRFLPKTKRFQLNTALTVVTNDPFFTTAGLALRGGYYLTETWGLELDYNALSTSNRQTTDELKSILGVNTESLIFPKSYMGASLVWSPIYGKMTYFNKKIIPFDLFFKLGLGSTQTQLGEAASTYHIGTGQLFAITKGMAFRWDFGWNFFNAKGTNKEVSSFNNLFLSLGVSFFIPEAKYR